MIMEKIILVGGGGHCLSCIDVIESGDEYAITGIIDLNEKVGRKILGYPIIGTDADLPEILETVKSFLITIGQIKTAVNRIKKYDLLKRIGGNLAVVISPTAYVSKHSEIGEGTIVMAHAFINSGACIGANAIVNTGAIIEHGVKIGRHCHIATSCVVNGDCTIGERVFLGSNSVLHNSVSITDDVILGAGSVVKSSIIESGTYAGNPARRIR